MLEGQSLRPSPACAPLRFRGLLAGAVVLGAAAVLAFLALRASPYLGDLPWLPRWLSRWADHHGVARNAAAFLGFGLLFFPLAGRRWPQIAGAAAFSIALELAQLWIPARIFDMKDIAASLLGLALAWGLTACLARAVRGRSR